jgi:hypothetical protein
MISWRSKNNVHGSPPSIPRTALSTPASEKRIVTNDEALSLSFDPKDIASIKVRAEIFTDMVLPKEVIQPSTGSVNEKYGFIQLPRDASSAAAGPPPSKEFVVIVGVSSATVNCSTAGVLEQFLTVTDKDSHEFATLNSNKLESGSTSSSRAHGNSNYDEALKTGIISTKNNPTKVVSIYRKEADKSPLRQRENSKMPSFPSCPLSPSTSSPFSTTTSSPPSSFRVKTISPVPPSYSLVAEIPFTETKMLQRFTVLNFDEVMQVNELRKAKGLSLFFPGSVLVEFVEFSSSQQEIRPTVSGAGRYKERGFLVLTPTRFEQTDVTLTVEITIEKNDVSLFETSFSAYLFKF